MGVLTNEEVEFDVVNGEMEEIDFREVWLIEAVNGVEEAPEFCSELVVKLPVQDDLHGAVQVPELTDFECQVK